jgi:predicted MFS family arabinose efflux permease
VVGAWRCWPRADLAAAGADRFRSLSGLLEVGRRPGVAVALIGVLLVISGHFAGFTYVRPVLEQVDHLDVGRSRWSLLAFGVAGFFGNFAGAAPGRARSAPGGAGRLGPDRGLAALAIVLLGASPAWSRSP